jgi:hypothetical protein
MLNSAVISSTTNVLRNIIMFGNSEKAFGNCLEGNAEQDAADWQSYREQCTVNENMEKEDLC